jgi:hypothetical protein
MAYSPPEATLTTLGTENWTKKAETPTANSFIESIEVVTGQASEIYTWHLQAFQRKFQTIEHNESHL